MKSVEALTLNDLKDSKLNVVEDQLVPHERQVIDAVIEIWSQDKSTESLGVVKLYTVVKKFHPNWSLSKDRFKNLIKKFGLAASGSQDQFCYVEHIRSLPTPGIELPQDIELIYTKKRGKGLFAKRDISKGLLLWSEKPLFLVPPLSHYELISSGTACSYCGKLLNDPSRSKSGALFLKGLQCDGCQEVWCSRECKVSGNQLHVALKHGRQTGKIVFDPSALDKLTTFCVKEQWNALYAITFIYAECLIDKSGLKRSQFDAMASISQRTRYKALNSSAGAFDSLQGGALFVEEQQESLWEQGYQMFLNVFKMLDITPPSLDEFLLMMGTYNINNLDSSVYLIQSHLNHNCDPTTDVRSCTKRHDGLSVYALCDIRAGKELTTTYVNPGHPVQQRQRELRVNWGFLCKCDKCKIDLESQQRRKSSSASNFQTRSEIRQMLSAEKEGELEIVEPLDYNGERRKSVRFDEVVLRVT